jgi:glutamate carboxypeptidase
MVVARTSSHAKGRRDLIDAPYPVNAEIHEVARLLRELVEIESPTGHRPGVRAVAERVAAELEAIGAGVAFDGDHLVAELDGAGEPLLLLGHTDTVWRLGTLDSMPFRVAGTRAYGPGVFDMKGGLVVLVEALRAAGPGRRPVRVFLTADEERGSVTARDALRRAAGGVSAALVLEPPTPGGALKTARKGLRRFRLVVEGRAAHAGTNPEHGASAIEELAHQVLRIKALDERLGSLRPVLDGTRLRLEEEHGRPPLEPTERSVALFAQAREHGLALGLELREATSGGGSDGDPGV